MTRDGAARWFHRRGWRQVLLGLPYLWLALFFAVPFAIVVAISFGTPTTTSPPVRFPGGWPPADPGSYLRLVQDPLYLRAFGGSLANALATTVLCLLFGYPMALFLARARGRLRAVLMILVILPFWTSFLLRVYAWMGLLGSTSWLNRGLTGLWNGLVPAAWHVNSLALMNSAGAVTLVMVYTYLPFMILPLFSALERLDASLDEAAMDLGSRPFRVFLDITLPLSRPGIVAGCLLVFIPACGELVIPNLVGNASRPLIGQVIADQFLTARNWPTAAAVAVALLATLVVPILCFNRLQLRGGGGAR